MGSGKTFMGHKLAKELDVDFIETDWTIAKEAGKSIPELFSTNGEQHFRDLEMELLGKIESSPQQAIISTGGGFPCFNENIDRMKKSGVTVFLDWPLETLMKRIEKNTNRPLVNDNRNRLQTFIADLMKERRPIYEKADVVLTEPDVEMLKNSISEILQSLSL